MDERTGGRGDGDAESAAAGGEFVDVSGGDKIISESHKGTMSPRILRPTADNGFMWSLDKARANLTLARDGTTLDAEN